MNTKIMFPIANEILQHDDLCKLTGRTGVNRQIAWLEENGWILHFSSLGSPIVGTWYARMKLAGIEPADLSVKGLTDPATLLEQNKLFNVNN